MPILKVYDGSDWVEVPILDGVPGGELGGTWSSPTVDGTHSGSAHHAEAHGPAKHTEGGNWKVLYTNGSGDEQEVALPADGLVFVGAGAAAAPVFEEIFISKEILFSALSDSPSTGDIVDGFPNGVKLPDSDERGTLTAISAWATCDDGNKGTGTNTIDIEVDSSQDFASPTVIFTITLGTASFAEDTTPQAWNPDTDKFIRAKWNTANASPPEKVRVGVVLKERAENY